MANSVTTHMTVLALKAVIEADSLFNDSPVSSFPAFAKVQSNPLCVSRKLAKSVEVQKTPAESYQS
ncbi:hypothetical protein HB779_15515 [Phyllobacterium sp. 628]|uniref:hypothetical protein n=1 Tax=Phyllobacterium sp. 628 TaxID=2718938 RepID=UPI001662416E|nr:hypothetical protein [Phyllobacterium sp. 628]QND53151.1 hypothetical protein HB779_15515 [Phyllobacterium sp. 628]